jgi:hypothetical protein
MSGWYPPGVTGNEYAIAGAEREWTDTRTVKCQNEDCIDYAQRVDAEVDLASYGSDEWGAWTCDSCGKDSEYEGTVERWEREYDDE